MSSFSLWTEQWIPVIDREGRARRLSLRDALVQAAEIQEIFDPSPLVEVAVFRLLQAILYRVFEIEDDEQWVELWQAATLDSAHIDRYGNEFRDCFDLLHPEKPFYQVSKIADEKEHPITALVLDAASGNNAMLFDHGQVEGGDWLPLDRAACHLVAYQAFALGGGVSKPFNRMDAPLSKGMIVQAVGRNLKESLLLNSLPRERWAPFIVDSGKDAPFWELSQQPAPKKEGTHPLGLMHYLTWQSRQIHLCLDSSGQRVVGCQIRQRYALPKTGEAIDPYKPYAASEKEGMQPLRLNKERAVWQYTNVLLRTSEKRAAPRLTEWIAHIQGPFFSSDGLDLPSIIGYSVVGIATHPRKAAKIDLWRRERLPIPSVYFDRPELVLELNELMRMANVVDRHLMRTAEALTWALAEEAYLEEALSYLWTGKTSSREAQRSLSNYRLLARSTGVVARFWADLGKSFHQMLLDLPLHGFVIVRESWQTTLIRTASHCFQEVINSLRHEERAFAILAPLDAHFHRRLYSILRNNLGKEGETDEEDDNTVA